MEEEIYLALNYKASHYKKLCMKKAEKSRMEISLFWATVLNVATIVFIGAAAAKTVVVVVVVNVTAAAVVEFIAVALLLLLVLCCC